MFLFFLFLLCLFSFLFDVSWNYLSLILFDLYWMLDMLIVLLSSLHLSCRSSCVSRPRKFLWSCVVCGWDLSWQVTTTDEKRQNKKQRLVFAIKILLILITDLYHHHHHHHYHYNYHHHHHHHHHDRNHYQYFNLPLLDWGALSNCRRFTNVTWRSRLPPPAPGSTASITTATWRSSWIEISRR